MDTIIERAKNAGQIITRALDPGGNPHLMIGDDVVSLNDYLLAEFRAVEQQRRHMFEIALVSIRSNIMSVIESDEVTIAGDVREMLTEAYDIATAALNEE